MDGMGGQAPVIALVSSTRIVLRLMEDAFQHCFPRARLLHILDETLLEDFARDGGISPRSIRKVLEMTFAASDAGVDAVLVTCSTLASSVDVLKSLSRVPVLRIDERAIEEMLESGARHVGLLGASDAVLNSIEPLVWSKAEALGANVVIDRFVHPEVVNELGQNPQVAYRAVGDAVASAARKCEAVLIGQVSLAPGWGHVPKDLRDRVFNMPEHAAAAARLLLEGM